MTNQQKKSECCGAKILRFGGKRRCCKSCRKTWRVQPAKRGRKALRKQVNYLNRVFVNNFTVKQLGFHSSVSVGAIYKRFSGNVNNVVEEKRRVYIRGAKLILVIDGQWQYFKGELWTMYFISVKSISSQTVTILDPVMRQGKECGSVWSEIFDAIPPGIRKRVVAVVSDGIRGIEGVAENNDWILQRCHFHLLSSLQKMRGKRATTNGRAVREEIYNSVKIAIQETSNYRLDILCKRLAVLAQDSGCPKMMRMIVRDFLRKSDYFRNYLIYPELNLPTTTNVMESVNSFVRRKTKPISTSKSWFKWTTTIIRLKSKFICK